MTKKRKFECQRCGDCCRIPAFFKVCNEYPIAMKISEKYDIKFIEITNSKAGPHLIPEISKQELDMVLAGDLKKASCPFILKTSDNKASCSIYEIRPVLCKLFGETKSCSVCPNQKVR